MKNKLSIINCQLSIPGLLFFLLALLCSCEQAGEDYRYPSVVTDYACLITDATGYAEQLLLDNGRCYPTSIILPLVPLLKAGLVLPEDIVVNSGSGVSGAGRRADVMSLPSSRKSSRMSSLSKSNCT